MKRRRKEPRKSEFVCRRCGSPVYFGRSDFGNEYVRHSNGGLGKTRSCGQEPDPIRRDEYESSISEASIETSY